MNLYKQLLKLVIQVVLRLLCERVRRVAMLCRTEESGCVGLGFGVWGFTWTPKVCRIIAFYRFWAIILPTFGGLGLRV